MANDCKLAVESNAFKNCPVIVKDIEIAEDICGPELATLKGKTTRKKPLVTKHDCVAVPKATKEKHKDLMSSVDAFSSLPFSIALSQNIVFATT